MEPILYVLLGALSVAPLSAVAESARRHMAGRSAAADPTAGILPAPSETSLVDGSQVDGSAPSAPVGVARVVWTRDVNRWETDHDYRDRVQDFLESHFPGQSPLPSEAKVLEDEAGHRVLGAECLFGADGTLHRQFARQIAHLPEGSVLP